MQTIDGIDYAFIPATEYFATFYASLTKERLLMAACHISSQAMAMVLELSRDIYNSKPK